MRPIIQKTANILSKAVIGVLLVGLFAVVATSVSPVYNFSEAKPFSGPDIFNPYAAIKGMDSIPWKRSNFHTHTRVKGIFNECEYWPDQTDAAYRKFGYDIVTFSNHNELTVHPYDTALQVNVYEHGINAFKYHKLVFGCEKVNRFDHILPLFVFQKQFQLDLLGKESDFIQMNHPLRTIGTSKYQMCRLEGYRIMELDSGKSTENEYWDWALSSGRYSFGLANDDLHFPDKTKKIAVRCNFLYCPSAKYKDIKETLLNGCYYAMRVPDYGHGDWEVKYARNRNLPYVRNIGLDSATVFITLSRPADSIKFIGQDHKTLELVRNSVEGQYDMKSNDPYVRITAYFPDGEVIYSNPFARYDASVADSPYREPSHAVNIPLTVCFNLIVVLLCVGLIMLFYKVIFKWRIF